MLSQMCDLSTVRSVFLIHQFICLSAAAAASSHGWLAFSYLSVTGYSNPNVITSISLKTWLNLSSSEQVSRYNKYSADKSVGDKFQTFPSQPVWDPRGLRLISAQNIVEDLVLRRSHCTLYDHLLAWYCRLSACPSVCPWRYALWLNDISYIRRVWTSEQEVPLYRNTILNLAIPIPTPALLCILK